MTNLVLERVMKDQTILLKAENDAGCAVSNARITIEGKRRAWQADR